MIEGKITGTGWRCCGSLQHTAFCPHCGIAAPPQSDSDLRNQARHLISLYSGRVDSELASIEANEQRAAQYEAYAAAVTEDNFHDYIRDHKISQEALAHCVFPDSGSDPLSAEVVTEYFQNHASSQRHSAATCRKHYLNKRQEIEIIRALYREAFDTTDDLPALRTPKTAARRS